MKTTNNQHSNRIAMLCFKYSLIIGTIFFISFCITKSDTIAIWGFFYLCIAVVINLVVLLTLLISLLTDLKNRLETMKAMGLLLVNIPIAYLYFWILTAFATIF